MSISDEFSCLETWNDAQMWVKETEGHPGSLNKIIQWMKHPKNWKKLVGERL